MSSSDGEEDIQKRSTTDVHDDLPIQQEAHDAWRAWSGNDSSGTNPVANSRHLLQSSPSSNIHGLPDHDQAAFRFYCRDAAGALSEAATPGLSASAQALQLARSQLSTTKSNQIASRASPVDAQKPCPSASPVSGRSSACQSWTPQPRDTSAPAPLLAETPSPPALRERKRGMDASSFDPMPTSKKRHVNTPTGTWGNLVEMEANEEKKVEAVEMEVEEEKEEDVSKGETEAGEEEEVEGEEEDEESESEELGQDEPVDPPTAEQVPPEARATESPVALTSDPLASTAAALAPKAEAARPEANAAPKAKAGAKVKAKAKAKAKAEPKARTRAKNGSVGCFAGNRPPTGGNSYILFRLKKLLHAQICDNMMQKHITKKNMAHLHSKTEIHFNSFVMGHLKKTAKNLNVSVHKLDLSKARDELKTSSDQWKGLLDLFIQNNDTVDLKKLPNVSENN